MDLAEHLLRAGADPNALAHDFCMVTWHHGVTFKSVRRVHLVTGRCPENARVLRAGSGRITPKERERERERETDRERERERERALPSR